MKWPQTTPIDKSDPYWRVNNNLNCNGVQYRKEEARPGYWTWVVDEEMMACKRDRESARRELYQALWTRVLTFEEMERALALGDSLNIEEMTPYTAADKKRELGDAFYAQARLRSLVDTKDVPRGT